MKKLFTIILLSLTTFFVANAQTSDSPWAVSLGANLVGVQDDSVDASTGFGVPSLSLSRYIAAGFSIGAQYSLNSLDIDKADVDYTAIDAILKYNISEGDIYPYLFAGYGLSSFKADADSEGLFPSSGAGRTYLGGAGNETPHSLVVDENDNLYLLGATSSTNFPTLSNSFDVSFNGGFAELNNHLYFSASDLFAGKLV